MFLELLFSVVFLQSVVHCSEDDASVESTGFGYELTVSGLDAINLNMQEDRLRYSQYYLSLTSEIADLQQTVAKIEKMIEQQSEMINDRFLELEADQVRDVVSKEDSELPRTCDDDSDYRSGLRQVRPQPGFSDSFKVYCDHDYEGGGWTVIQNRYDGSFYFYRGWDDYVNGFGDLKGEFWLGLKKIHELTYSKRHELHIVMEDFVGKVVVAKYNHFLVGGTEVKFTLDHLGNYSGNAGDSLSPAIGMKFSTLDADNDSYPTGNCAVHYRGGWWYTNCLNSNLNGPYLPGDRKLNGKTMCWQAFRGYNYGLKRSRMMIRATASSRRQ